MSAPRRTGRRAGLTERQVIDAARRVLDADGLPGLTMRALADALGVAPNALYSHVASKDALVDAILDDVLGEIRPPRRSGDWRAALRRLMLRSYEVLLRHPDLVGLYLSRPPNGRNAQRLGAMMHARFEQGGITGDRAQQALRTLVIFTIGFAAFATRDPALGGASRDVATANFAEGLDWILAGIAARA